MKKIIAILIGAGLLFTAACTKGTESSQQKDQAVTQSYYEKLSNKVPYPVAEMNDSLERRNLREKLLRFNQPDKIGYIYLLSQTGEVISFFTVKGKVSSTQSQMTAADIVSTHCDGGACERGIVTTGPGDDASYGQNEDGVFWFTTEDVYMTWNGMYLYMDAPLKVDSVTHQIVGLEDGAAPTSVGESVEKRTG